MEKQTKKKHARRKLTEERADAINRKRDLVEGHERSFERDYWRVRVGPGRSGLMRD